MIVRNHIGKNGTQILEYIPQNDADIQQLAIWMQDGTIPAEASQSHPPAPKMTETFDEQLAEEKAA